MGTELSLWNDTDTRNAIRDFVERTTVQGSQRYVPNHQRLAVFDNDGTLWSEQPMYFQLAFAIDRLKELAPDHPEWEHQDPFKFILDGDLKRFAAGGLDSVMKVVEATHAGMTSDEFAAFVENWMKSARHPVSQRPYYEMVYQPQLQFMQFLRENGYTTYIVSGGGVDFMRVFAEPVYSIPPAQVIGTFGEKQFEMRDGKPVLINLPRIGFINDGPGKPVGIHTSLGQTPTIAVGNSDGDYEMLQFVTGADGPRLGLLVHHDDADREVAYDRGSPFGGLDKGLDDADANGWHVISMKNDWAEVFAPSSADG